MSNLQDAVQSSYCPRYMLETYSKSLIPSEFGSPRDEIIDKLVPVPGNDQAVLVSSREENLIKTFIKGKGITESYNALISQAEAFLCLEQGWDGYNASPIDPCSFADFKSWLSRLAKQASRPTLLKVMPESDGSISAYLEHEDYYCEFGFPGDSTYHYFSEQGDKTITSQDDREISSLPPKALFDRPV